MNLCRDCTLRDDCLVDDTNPACSDFDRGAPHGATPWNADRPEEGPHPRKLAADIADLYAAMAMLSTEVSRLNRQLSNIVAAICKAATE